MDWQARCPRHARAAPGTRIAAVSAPDNLTRSMTRNIATPAPSPGPGPDPHPADEAPPGTPQTAEGTCPRCGGAGTLDGRPCPGCNGSGTVNVNVGDA